MCIPFFLLHFIFSPPPAGTKGHSSSRPRIFTPPPHLSGRNWFCIFYRPHLVGLQQLRGKWMLATFIIRCLHTDCKFTYNDTTAMFLVQILPYTDMLFCSTCSVGEVVVLLLAIIVLLKIHLSLHLDQKFKISLSSPTNTFTKNSCNFYT